jgi:hypothetical protein
MEAALEDWRYNIWKFYKVKMIINDQDMNNLYNPGKNSGTQDHRDNPHQPVALIQYGF